ncbi:DsbA family protein [Pseudooceanicola nanhaiensis]|uniref:DsbA family protein n=1 Tax=Pseudooceanicola nanhaiensis TaxID=375761 RepID=UPI001CD6E1F0|nr:DsbA family protein [Pseudooceanicola nanhaiensis]MCA0920968.1 DsbA family protein [Pseudooceanicola nanhaiensis]
MTSSKTAYVLSAAVLALGVFAYGADKVRGPVVPHAPAEMAEAMPAATGHSEKAPDSHAAAPAGGFEMADLSEMQRDALRREIQSYLMDHPEVIFEAVEAYRARETEVQQQAQTDMLKSEPESIYADGFSWVGGNLEGDVVLIEFMDYRCGYCRRAFEDVKSLVADDGNIKFIVKEYPVLGDDSITAARFAIATLQVAGDEAYEQVHNAMMTMRGNPGDKVALSRLGESLGLDTDAIFARMDDEAVTEVIGTNRALGDALGINGTPTFLFDHQLVVGAVPRSQMEEIIADLREAAE